MGGIAGIISTKFSVVVLHIKITKNAYVHYRMNIKINTMKSWEIRKVWYVMKYI